MATSDAPFTIRLAELSDLPQLGVLTPRCFHSISVFHQRSFPNTPKLREWWTAVFRGEISSPSSQPYVAVSKADNHIIGIIATVLLEADDQSAGFFTKHPYTSDHDIELFQPAVDAMVEYRTKIYSGTGKQHYMIQLFGVEDDSKGTGAGKALLKTVCDMADREGKEVFVESNGKAKNFYMKVGGFESQGEISVSLGDDGSWEEHLLVRKPKAT